MKLMVCPSDLAAAVTVPPTIPITRAGQHQAPMRAGMDNSSANNEQHIALLDSLGVGPLEAEGTVVVVDDDDVDVDCS